MTSANIVPQVEIAGQTTIDDQVIGAIANTAAREVEGVPAWAPVRYAASLPNAWAALNGGPGA